MLVRWRTMTRRKMRARGTSAIPFTPCHMTTGTAANDSARDPSAEIRVMATTRSQIPARTRPPRGTTKRTTPTAVAHPFPSPEAVEQRIAMADDGGQAGTDGERRLGVAGDDHAECCRHHAFQHISDEHHRRRAAAEGPHDVGGARVAAPDGVDVDAVHPADDHCEVEAPDDVGAGHGDHSEEERGTEGDCRRGGNGIVAAPVYNGSRPPTIS